MKASTLSPDTRTSAGTPSVVVGATAVGERGRGKAGRGMPPPPWRAQAMAAAMAVAMAVLLNLTLTLTGCRPAGDADREGDEAGSGGAAAYGDPVDSGPTATVPAVVARPLLSAALPAHASLAVLETELFPASLWRSREDRVRVFANLAAGGLGGPTFLSYSSPTGIASMRPGDVLEGSELRENWILAGFAGAAGWTNWDSPWAVFLERKPARVDFGTNGVELRFEGAAGHFALMPLYGYEKPPQEGREFDPGKGPRAPRLRGAKGRDPKLFAWEWPLAVARDPLTRLRYWAGATRRFPVRCEDTVSVDRERGTLTLRERFEWLEVPDEWGTRPIRIAPVPPTLGLALLPGARFPLGFDRPPFDFGVATPFGPFFGIPNVDGYEVRFPLLKYVNATERPVTDLPADAPPVVAAALERLRTVARGRFPGPDRFQPDPSPAGNGPAAGSGDVWYSKALPYYDAATRSNAVASLGRHYREALMDGDAGRPVGADLLQELWAYAHFSGDHALIRERWPAIRRLQPAGRESRWAGFGGEGVAELGDEAAPALAFARLAYMAGDLGAYRQGCAAFVRGLVRLHVRQRAAGWFRDRQPWHSMEPIDADVHLTRIAEGMGGWQFDGPGYPAGGAPRLSARRWSRFQDLDVARFYRDHLADDVRSEFARLAGQWDPRRVFTDEGGGLPSQVRLESFLLGAAPADLAALAMPDRFEGSPAGILASCVAVLRTARVPRLQRLIPGGPASEFTTEPGDDAADAHPHLAMEVRVDSGEGRPPAWPRIDWPLWISPSGGPWSFGEVQAGNGSGPGPATRERMNRNTERIVLGSAPGPRPKG